MFKYQHILEAMAERAKVSETPWDVIQYKNPTSDYWTTHLSFPSFLPDCEYRVKPKEKVKLYLWHKVNHKGDITNSCYSTEDSVGNGWYKTNTFIEKDI